MDIQTLSITVGILTACITVIIGVISFVKSNRRAEEQRALTLQTQQQALETRQAELFMNVFNRWNARDVQMAYGNTRFRLIPQIKDFSDYQQKVLDERAKGNLEPWFNIQLIATYMEGLGMLVKRGLIDIELVEDLFSNRIKWYWENFFTTIGNIRRKQLNDMKLYDSAEYLYHELKQREQRSTVTT